MFGNAQYVRSPSGPRLAGLASASDDLHTAKTGSRRRTGRPKSRQLEPADQRKQVGCSKSRAEFA